MAHPADHQQFYPPPAYTSPPPYAPSYYNDPSAPSAPSAPPPSAPPAAGHDNANKQQSPQASSEYL